MKIKAHNWIFYEIPLHINCRIVSLTEGARRLGPLSDSPPRGVAITAHTSLKRASAKGTAIDMTGSTPTTAYAYWMKGWHVVRDEGTCTERVYGEQTDNQSAMITVTRSVLIQFLFILAIIVIMIISYDIGKWCLGDMEFSLVTPMLHWCYKIM